MRVREVDMTIILIFGTSRLEVYCHVGTTCMLLALIGE
jgi:hypothetical protein